MSALAELVSSRVRAEVLRLLYGIALSELHGRELARRSGFNEATVRQEMRKLRRLDLVSARRAGNRVYYRANRSHPLYPELHNLVLKTNGLVEVLGEALKGVHARVVFVFGSLAGGTPAAGSDVDLMVVGETTLRELAVMLEGTSETLGREINPHVLTEAEYRERLLRGDHFVTHVLDGPKLYIIGSQNDLAELGRA
jgi:DNA-binding transcriptional ArsR family regulator